MDIHRASKVVERGSKSSRNKSKSKAKCGTSNKQSSRNNDRMDTMDNQIEQMMSNTDFVNHESNAKSVAH